MLGYSHNLPSVITASLWFHMLTGKTTRAATGYIELSAPELMRAQHTVTEVRILFHWLPYIILIL